MNAESYRALAATNYNVLKELWGIVAHRLNVFSRFFYSDGFIEF